MSGLIVKAQRGDYEVVVQQGALQALGDHVVRVMPTHSRGRRVLVVEDDAIKSTHGEAAVVSLQAAGLQVTRTSIHAKESCKHVDTVAAIWDAALAGQLQRSDAIVAVGGGITGDVAGFAAATWLRGIDVIQVPTTLLAMVDAAIGGKTGVNVPLPASVGGGLGKNMAGAFWPPRLVLSDPQVLQTLPVRELRCGLAECVKHGMLSDESLLEALAELAQQLSQGAVPCEALESLIRTAVAVKIAVVNADEHEAGQRALLNLGHTFAHAIEGRPGMDLKHGEAVAIGLVGATQVALALGMMPPARLEAIQALIETLGLPMSLPEPVSAQELLDRMAWDKKNTQGTLRLVVPMDPTGAQIMDDVDPNHVLNAWRSLGAT